MRISAFHAISMKELATSDAVCVHSDPRCPAHASGKRQQPVAYLGCPLR